MIKERSNCLKNHDKSRFNKYVFHLPEGINYLGSKTKQNVTETAKGKYVSLMEGDLSSHKLRYILSGDSTRIPMLYYTTWQHLLLNLKTYNSLTN